VEMRVEARSAHVATLRAAGQLEQAAAAAFELFAMCAEARLQVGRQTYRLQVGRHTDRLFAMCAEARL
jgi:hypothetical protein